MRGFICAAVCAASMAHATTVLADTPCDFKGLSVGDKLTPAAIMAALGIKQFKMNPQRPSFQQSQPNMEKYGLMGAGEMEDWNIGPYCDASICAAPYGVTVGNDSTPVSIVVGFHDGIVTEIDVSFAHTFWDDLLPIINNKYGDNWKVDNTTDAIIDLPSKKSTQVERTMLTHRNDGTNQKTRDKCQIWANNYDVVFTHHDGLGPYHSQLVIKLVSKNF
jgi:hypothetical protein